MADYTPYPAAYKVTYSVSYKPYKAPPRRGTTTPPPADPYQLDLSSDGNLMFA